MFTHLIAECRLALEGRGRKRRKVALSKDLDERPEVSTVPSGLAKRGYEGIKPYGDPRAARSTVGGGRFGQSSHT